MYQSFFRHLAALLVCGTCFLPPQAKAAHPPAPLTEIAVAAGSWQGKLLYNDYASPGNMVTLPTRLHVALSQPDTLVLYFIYDDGPGKIVYGYDQMQFDLKAGLVNWRSGDNATATQSYQITAVQRNAAGTHFSLSRQADALKIQYQLTIAASSIVMEKTEVAPASAAVFRHRYEFSRQIP
jgi:hypothetical protein